MNFMTHLDFERLQKLDSCNMYEVLKNFPQQIVDSLSIAKSVENEINFTAKRFLLLGMGGSAIAGDLLQTYFRNSNSDIFITCNRNHLVLNEITSETVVIASSYSGNTEETLTAFNHAMKQTKKIFGISSGGQLETELKNQNLPVVKIPSGYQPRVALGYVFFTLLLLINKIKCGSITKDFEQEIAELYSLLKQKSKEFSELSENNPAIELAQKLYGKIVITYACEETLFPVALRFRSQVQENAKNLAFANSIPEMNHNEINSFQYPKGLIDKIQFVLLSDDYDFEGNQKRLNVLIKILSEINQPIRLKSVQNSFLLRMFELIYLLDWTSFYLSIMNEIDPTPIPIITRLKNELQYSNL